MMSAEECRRYATVTVRFVRSGATARKGGQMRKQPLPRRDSLGRHLAWVLLVKAMLLSAIWFVWFRAPPVPEPQQIAAALLSSPPAAGCTPKDACDATHP